jgi:tRNA threonylcarbamoyl adenosine modification protein YeaZ
MNWGQKVEPMGSADEGIVLALEAGLAGGTVSILRHGSQIDFSVGQESVSKSEDILAMIERLLEKNGIKRRDIGLIAVSDEPGSLTGLRIGLATAKGLADSLAKRVFRMSLLDALAVLSDTKDSVFCGYFAKNRGFYYKGYSFRDERYAPQGSSGYQPARAEFACLLDKAREEFATFVFNEDLYLELRDIFEQRDASDLSKIRIVKGNPAEILGRLAASYASDNVSKPETLFLDETP